ncbi:MAG: gamma-glutamyltransferase, partial [Deltaproteobacteria bacterium]|nr:gamma-glutamyltransferase [Deltaproteobacteria bacterium]
MTNWTAIEQKALHSKPGPREVATGKRAVVSTDNPIVTETALRTLRNGGNAADAAVAACLVQSTIEQHLTNHTGLITCLYWDAKTKTAHQLESAGTFPSHLPLFQPVPPVGGLSMPGMIPAACIPGQIPGLEALRERFGTKSWSDLCEDAVYWAENGHLVNSMEIFGLNFEAPFINFFPEGRAHFSVDGRFPQCGDRFHSRELEHTLRQLQKEGPSYFTEGEWAQKFVAKANEIGWAIELKDMTAVPPRWIEPQSYEHRGVEIVQQAPPERQAAFCAMVL